MKLQKVNGYDSGGTSIFMTTERLRGQDIFGYCLYILIDELVDSKSCTCANDMLYGDTKYRNSSHDTSTIRV